MYLDISAPTFHMINIGLPLKRLQIEATSLGKIVIHQFDKDYNLIDLYIPSTKLRVSIEK